jgi:hypothetical protein
MEPSGPERALEASEMDGIRALLGRNERPRNVADAPLPTPATTSSRCCSLAELALSRPDHPLLRASRRQSAGLDEQTEGVRA